jgi:hypothetical protein
VGRICPPWLTDLPNIKHGFFCACLKTSWNYGDKYTKYKSETISLINSQICLLSQQKYNKTVVVWVTKVTRHKNIRAYKLSIF